MSDDLPPRADEFRHDLLEWAEANLREYPWREPKRSVYEVFVAEFFLTQTPADNVERVYPDFLRRFPNLAALAEASQPEIENAIESLGFQRMRSEALKEIANTHDAIPRNPDDLRELPRVGPYVAAATICFALSEPLPILDRNVIRVYDRVFGDAFPSGDVPRTEFAEQILPKTGSRARRYNLALLDFGAGVCRKQEPYCETCFARSYCEYVNSASISE